MCFVIARVPKKKGTIESTMLNFGLSSHGKKHPINAITTVDAHVRPIYFQFHHKKFLTVIILGGRAFASAIAVGTFTVTFFLLPISTSSRLAVKSIAIFCRIREGDKEDRVIKQYQSSIPGVGKRWQSWLTSWLTWL